MRSFSAIAAAVALAMSILPSGPATAQDLAEAFAAPPGLNSISLSDSGQRIAVIVQRDSLFHIEVRDAAAPQVAVATYSMGPGREPNWVRWKGDSRILVSVDVPTGRFGSLLNERRLISFDPSLNTPVMLNQTRKKRAPWYPPFQDRITSMLDDDPTGVLLTFDWEKPVNPGLYRADVVTGRLTPVRDNVRGVVGWLADSTGRNLIGLGDVLHGRSPLYRTTGDSAEQMVLPGVHPEAVFEPLAMDGHVSRVAVLSNHEGGTTGAYIYDTAQGAFVQTLFKHPRHDAEGVRLSPDQSQVVAVRYTDDISRYAFTHEATEQRAQRISDMVGEDDTWTVDETSDGRFAVVGAYAGTRPDSVFWLDTATGEKRKIADMYARLEARPAAPVYAVSYPAEDGLEIPGYIILPPGTALDEARELPFVVMPHGGPHARDDADFDFIAEYLANLGYGVLKPNFRGSTGYGEAFRQAGEKEWGGAILGDVAQGTRWIAAKGYADPDRICIAGWSFGGYLSLMAAAEHPELFKCAAAVAPVTDLLALIGHAERFFGGDEIMSRMIGRAWRDRSRLADESPARRARDITMPVLLMHGELDDVVPLSHTTNMAQALERQSAIKPEVHTFRFADHSITRESYRLQMLRALKAFLDRNIPADAPPSPA